MLILEVYFLVLIIITLWSFGVKPTIRDIFKKIMNMQLEKSLGSSVGSAQRKRLLRKHCNVINILSQTTYRELLVLLPIAKDLELIRQSNTRVRSRPVSRAEQEYLEVAAQCIFVCLSSCTVTGFIKICIFLLRRLIVSLFSERLRCFTRSLAQPAALMVFLAGAFCNNHGIAYQTNIGDALSNDGDCLVVGK